MFACFSVGDRFFGYFNVREVGRRVRYFYLENRGRGVFWRRSGYTEFCKGGVGAEGLIVINESFDIWVFFEKRRK